MKFLKMLLRVFQVLVPLAVIPILIYSYSFTNFCSWQIPEGTKAAEAKIVFIADPQIEGDARVNKQGFLGAVDLTLNDLYFQHISTTIATTLKPTHSIFLGDLFSSEYITPSEYFKRAKRFQKSFNSLYKSTVSINVTGNHDVGYGFNMVSSLVERFEKVFGKTNSRHFIGGHLFVNINSMALEGSDPKLRRETWKFIEDCALQATKGGYPVVLITHIPLYKQIDEENDEVNRGCDQFIIHKQEGMIIDQTHLTELVSEHLLEVLKPKLIFNGHDHNGCFWMHNNSIPEYTVRSIMGDYGGNTMLMSIIKKGQSNEFEYLVSSCKIGLRMRDYVHILCLIASWISISMISFFVNCCCCCCCCSRRAQNVVKEKQTSEPSQTKKKEEKHNKQEKQKKQAIKPKSTQKQKLKTQ